MWFLCGTDSEEASFGTTVPRANLLQHSHHKRVADQAVREASHPSFHYEQPRRQ